MNKVTRTEIGTVISDKMNKSITVLVMREWTHPLYSKSKKISKKIHAHDENNDCRVGDKVQVKSCRPLSKTKSWILDLILEKAH